jgi:hypothetical protein
MIIMKRGTSPIVKILLIIPILSSLILGLNGLLFGLTKQDFLGYLLEGPLLRFGPYAILGALTLVVSIVFAIKIIKE